MNKTVDKSFELEQQFLDCWTITSNIDTIIEGVLEYDMTQDQIANALLGLKELYEIKFDKAFRTFESVHGDICRLTKEQDNESGT